MCVSEGDDPGLGGGEADVFCSAGTRVLSSERCGRVDERYLKEGDPLARASGLEILCQVGPQEPREERTCGMVLSQG